MRRVSGPGSVAPTRIFRPEDPSMTQKQRVLQGRHSLQLIVNVTHPSIPPIIWSPTHPPTIHPSIHQPFIHSADKPNILGQDMGAHSLNYVLFSRVSQVYLQLGWRSRGSSNHTPR